jgi:glutamate dehydrogenase/leucine dehydrogenase
MNQETLLPQIDLDVEQGFDPHLSQMVELERIARALDVEDAILEQMRHAELELTIHLPASRSDGAAANISALQCLYSHSSGCITELAIGPDVFLNQVRASAFANDLSCALLGLELRGGAAGIICDLSQYSEREMRRLFRGYCQRLRATLPSLFGFSRVYGGNRAIHGWLGHGLEGAGKGFGAVRQAESQWTLLARWITELIAAAGQPGLRTYAIQGCAGLGLAIARAVSGRGVSSLSGNTGARVIMMSDASGAILNDAGVDVAQLESHIQREQMLFGYPEAEHAYSADLSKCACDVLVLQAPMQITAANAGQVQAKLIVECVPESVSHAAKAELAARGVEVIPEVLVRIGLVLLSAADSGLVPLAESRLRALLRRTARKLMPEIRRSTAIWKTDLSRAVLSLAMERRANQIRRAAM